MRMWESPTFLGAINFGVTHADRYRGTLGVAKSSRERWRLAIAVSDLSKPEFEVRRESATLITSLNITVVV